MYIYIGIYSGTNTPSSDELGTILLGIVSRTHIIGELLIRSLLRERLYDDRFFFYKPNRGFSEKLRRKRNRKKICLIKRCAMSIIVCAGTRESFALCELTDGSIGFIDRSD